MTIKFSLGPVAYCWQKSAVFSFYQAVAQSKIPLVYLGETVCSRRREIKFSDYFEIAKQLKNAGKQVVLSTLALIEAKSEITELKKIINNGEFIIEANDMAAVQLASEHHLPFVAGPEINHYNLQSLNLLHKLGMQRFVMPVELSRTWLEKVLEQKNQLNFEAEVIGYGHLPLAHSARCFTARHQGLAKDDCQTICLSHPNGILVNTQEQQSLLRLNGIQTQSAACVDLQAHLIDMEHIGVDWYRICPISAASLDYAEALINGCSAPEHEHTCDGYWLGEAGLTSSII